MPESIGVIGVGTMASAIVRGLCRAKLSIAPRFVVGPRNAEKAASLAKEFPEAVRVASSNQEVIDSSMCVILAVLPKQAEEVLSALTFKAGQQILSVIATLPVARLQSLVTPATDCALATPLPAVAKRQGATLGLLRKPFSEAIFNTLGSFVVADNEEQYKRMQCITTLMGDFYKRQLTAQEWLVGGGVGKDQAGAWVGAVFKTIAADSAEASGETFRHLVDEQTPGGLNEMVWKGLEADGGYAAVQHSLESAHYRYVSGGKIDPDLAPCQKRARCGMSPKDSARRVIEDYYFAINCHSVEGMLQKVSEDVAVTFLESHRNWSGKAVAAEKFGNWFRQCPSVHADYEFSSIDCEEGDIIRVVLQCDFGKGKHAMGYLLKKGLICQIEHK